MYLPEAAAVSNTVGTGLEEDSVQNTICCNRRTANAVFLENHQMTTIKTNVGKPAFFGPYILYILTAKINQLK
jgi:hypothetical protein